MDNRDTFFLLKQVNKHKKKSNQRKAILKVNARAREHKQYMSRRMGGVVLFFTLLVGIAWLFVVGTCWAGRMLFSENNLFIVRQLDLASDGPTMTRKLILEFSGVRSGVNLFALDLREVCAKLEKAASVDDVEVERILPDTLKIRIRESIPVARITGRKIPMALDRNAKILGPKSSSTGLPAINGIQQAGLTPGETIKDPRVTDALQLLARFDEPRMRRLCKIKSIDLHGPDTLLAELTSGIRCLIPREKIDRALLRLARIYPVIQRRDMDRMILDLSTENNIPGSSY